MGASQSFDFQYSVEVAPSTNPQRTGTRRNATHPDACVESLPGLDLKNSWDLFQLGCQTSPHGNALGKRVTNPDGSLGGYEWLTYSELEDVALRLGSALMDLDTVSFRSFPDEVYPGSREMRLLGIFARNRVDWFITEQAANAFGITLVPLYDTLGEEAVTFIMGATNMETVAASLEGAIFLLRTVKDQSSLKCIILFDEPNQELESLAKQYNVKVEAFTRLLSWENKRPACPAAPEQVATLAFTSGTTGNPKGVILSHKNFVSTVCGVLRGPLAASDGLKISNADIHISYLPLAHVFERAVCNVLLAKGAAIGVYSGDTLKLLEDIRALQPTIFISVPRLFSRINDKVFGGVKDKSAVAQYLFNSGMSTKLKNLRADAAVTHSIWDSLVFNKTKQLMGGRLRYMLVGGAPLEANIQDHIKVLFCAPLCEGYGLTETLGTTVITSPKDPLSGHVGGPVPCIEFCLESVPEMDYTVDSTPPRGELLFRGPQLSHGYFGQPEATAQAFDKHGWFHTGDIVVLLPSGAIKIIDRKKNIFKLAQGEYIAPEKIEAIYQQSLLVGQVFAFGFSSKFYLVGIVVPDDEGAARWALKNNLAGTSLEELCGMEDFKKAVIADMEKTAKEGGLKGFEKLKEITLKHEPFTLENGLLTPTFKLKRHFAKQYYESDINAMYAKSA